MIARSSESFQWTRERTFSSRTNYATGVQRKINIWWTIVKRISGLHWMSQESLNSPPQRNQREPHNVICLHTSVQEGGMQLLLRQNCTCKAIAPVFPIQGDSYASSSGQSIYRHFLNRLSSWRATSLCTRIGSQSENHCWFKYHTYKESNRIVHSRP